MGKGILNLGCGNRIVEGAVNHDRMRHRPEVDVTHDLNVTPWPFADNSADEIQLISVAEHLEIMLIDTLNECWRILRPGGRLIIKYPLAGSQTIHDDPTHRWFWSDKALDFFDPAKKYGQTTGFYTDRKWAILQRSIIKERNLKAVLSPRKAAIE